MRASCHETICMLFVNGFQAVLLLRLSQAFILHELRACCLLIISLCHFNV